MSRSNWHRVFHPLCGADPATLVELIVRNGLPSASGLLRLGIALASSIGRLPFTATERAWTAFALHRAGPMPPPIFIIGHMRSGTTHLHNLLAASGQFATVPPVLAGMPWEAPGLARVLRPFVEQYLPEDRLIDSVRVQSDSPIEDEIALANMHTLSYYHAMYFPRRFEETYRRGLLLDTGEEVARWQRTLRHYVGKMTELGAGRPLLLKNPAIRRRSARSVRCGRMRGSSTSTAIPTSCSNRRAVRSASFCASWPSRATSMSRSMRWCSRCTRG